MFLLYRTKDKLIAPFLLLFLTLSLLSPYWTESLLGATEMQIYRWLVDEVCPMRPVLQQVDL
ncbi:MAG TPA: hypothetical protein VK667_04505, partial [Ktedonobacteraceae bacterium]|nr:hypothetical protein [Ktedonobacteraceae bacterium]